MKCTKDLIMNDGAKGFCCGQVYEYKQTSHNDTLCFIGDLSENHYMDKSDVDKHFTKLGE